MTTFTKTFAKRATDKSEGGEVGTLALTGPKNLTEGWTIALDGEAAVALPPESVHAILSTYLFQAFSDAYAGAKTLEDAKAALGTRFNAAHTGTLGQRGPSTAATDPAEAEAFKLLRAELKRTQPDWYAKHLKGATTAEAAKVLRPVLDANPDVRKQGEAEAKRKAEAAKAVGKIKLKI